MRTVQNLTLLCVSLVILYGVYVHNEYMKATIRHFELELAECRGSISPTIALPSRVTVTCYHSNYRSFVLPLKHTYDLNTNAWQYHTPRTPQVNLPKNYTKEYGVIHLQSFNKKYYALKQLWYKHYEFKVYNNSIDSINQKYDVVVNNLNFNPLKIDEKLIKGIDLDLSFFDELAEIKGYKKFIEENYNDDLITFGKEFL